MRTLICPDKFKDCLSAFEASRIIADALSTQRPAAQPDLCPLTDGGDGFAEILTRAANGVLSAVEVTGPQGDTVLAHFGVVRVRDIAPQALARLNLPVPPLPEEKIAVVEMAAASGLMLLPQDKRTPWKSHTGGTGEVIAAASQAGVAAILVGLGGSATHDLGLGALCALGYTFHDAEGNALDAIAPENWHRIHVVKGGIHAALPPLRLVCDVTNPLLGPRGAAAVYAPQKGLKAEDFPRLEAESARVAQLLCGHHSLDFHTTVNTPGCGAAGGIAFGLLCAGGAKAALVPGFDLVADWLRLSERIDLADIVITGEGRFDESSLQGKGPGGLASAALKAGKPVYVFAGGIDVQPRPNLHLHPITPAGMPLGEALSKGEELLHDAVLKAFA